MEAWPLRSELIAAALLMAAALPLRAAEPPHHLGTPVTEQEIAPWNIDIGPDGAGLPAGHGSVQEGAEIFANTCAACHGAEGKNPISPALRLVGGKGTLATAKPVQTVGSYWPYATTLFDYIRRAMPFTAPQSLAPNQVYALSAYLLWLNGVVPQDAVMNASTLPAVRMPNRGGFITVYKPPPG
jgi:S-disulfanyl-L-cysteine oxidoreductase SoxD